MQSVRSAPQPPTSLSREVHCPRQRKGCRPGDRSFGLGWEGARVPAGPREPHPQQGRDLAGRWPGSNRSMSLLATSTSSHLGPNHCVSTTHCFTGCWQGVFFIAVPFPAGTMLTDLAALLLPARLDQWMLCASLPSAKALNCSQPTRDDWVHAISMIERHHHEPPPHL